MAMSQSPMHRLVARHLCTCRLPATYVRASFRPLSTSSHSSAQHWTPGVGAYGSSEHLKRRYQRDREDDGEYETKSQAQVKRRMRNAGLGIVACALGLAGSVYLFPVAQAPTKNDAPPAIPGVPDTSVRDEIEQVQTGTSTVPTFPKHIHLSEVAAPADAAVVDKGEQEYQLVGLGIRTVFYVQVYVVGLYIAVADIAKLQERLIRTVDPVATTLVPGEKGKLKDMLLDPVKGQEIWNEILQDGGIRMAFRIVPTRNTDFVHLRDGWVRGMTAKTQQLASKHADQSFSDESFGASLNTFKTVLGGGFRKKVPWGDTVLLTRDGDGLLNSWYEDKNADKVNLGSVKDERISRLLWLIYLGGAKVSSEPLRTSVVEGVMEFVGRPVGTVATQVV